jgi:hypothetical protein
MTRRKYVYLYRSAVSGKFVSAAFAKRDPETTIRQRVKYANPAY